MNKKVKVVFDPEFFEAFTGTQEELDQVMAEIRAEFENKTVDEIREMSKPVDVEELDDEELDQIKKVLSMNRSNKPTLQ